MSDDERIEIAMQVTAVKLELRIPRRRSKPIRLAGGGRRRIARRACNGCSRPLGDATPTELAAMQRSLELPDVRAECPACTPNPPGLEWYLELPYTRPPLSMNGGRGHWRAHAATVHAVRLRAAVQARLAQIPPLHRAVFELHYAPRGDRTRDPLNLAPTLKALEDGLVDANLVPDDNPTYVHPTMPVIDEPTKRKAGRMYLVIRELQGGTS